jgi:hypothetical protein
MPPRGRPIESERQRQKLRDLRAFVALGDRRDEVGFLWIELATRSATVADCQNSRGKQGFIFGCGIFVSAIFLLISCLRKGFESLLPLRTSETKSAG